MKTGPDWDIVVRAYSHFGIHVLLDAKVTPSGFVYHNKTVALDAEPNPWMALHDLAHYIVATKNEPGRELEPNYALGKHPLVRERRVYKQNMGRYESEQEEGEASALHVVVTNLLLGPERADEVSKELSVHWDGEEVIPSRNYNFDAEDFDFSWIDSVKAV